MTTKATLNARVRITTGPAANLYGRISHIDEALWRADVALDDGRKIKNIALKACELVSEESVTDRSKLLDRIRKIWAKAESLKKMGPEYEAEAATFAASAQKMLAKYKLSLSDLDMQAMERDEPVGEDWADVDATKHGEWMEELARVVARAHFCRASAQKGWTYLVGRETDRKIAAFVIATLQRAALELSKDAARRFRKEQRKQHGATTRENKNFRHAWLSGFVERIAERYREEERQMEREQKASGGRSLVLVKKNALDAVDAHNRAEQQRRSDEARQAADEHRKRAEENPAEAERQRKAAERAANRTHRTRYTADPDDRYQAGEGAHRAGRAAGREAANSVSIRGTGLGESKSAKQLED